MEHLRDNRGLRRGKWTLTEAPTLRSVFYCEQLSLTIFRSETSSRVVADAAEPSVEAVVTGVPVRDTVWPTCLEMSIVLLLTSQPLPSFAVRRNTSVVVPLWMQPATVTVALDLSFAW